ncbi:Uncharacterised protein [Klebsiella pneumoniae]|nr:Uncharacterised protein [Klebsiella pneumoniae]
MAGAATVRGAGAAAESAAASGVAAGVVTRVNHAASAGTEWRCVAGEFTDVNPAVGRGRACCLLAWRSVGVDDVDLRFNRPAESGGT